MPTGAYIRVALYIIRVFTVVRTGTKVKGRPYFSCFQSLVVLKLFL